MGSFFSWLPAFGWILIPITAILVGAFKEWLKFREKTQRLDASSEEVARAIAALRDDRDELRRRVEQLESHVMARRLPARAPSLPDLLGDAHPVAAEDVADSPVRVPKVR